MDRFWRLSNLDQLEVPEEVIQAILWDSNVFEHHDDTCGPPLYADFVGAPLPGVL